MSFSSQAVLKSDFTQDANALNAAVDGLEATGETALWDGLDTAAQLFDKHPDFQPNVVLLSDGADTVSSASESAGRRRPQRIPRRRVRRRHRLARVQARSPAGPRRGSGGSLLSSADPKDLTAQFARVRQAIENQFEVIYQSAGNGGSADRCAGGGGAIDRDPDPGRDERRAATPPAAATGGGGLLAGS